jgi:hypothetical protein
LARADEASGGEVVGPSLVSASVNGMEVLQAALPECLKHVWAERSGRRRLLLRQTMTIQQAREHLSEILAGPAAAGQTLILNWSLTLVEGHALLVRYLARSSEGRRHLVSMTA